VVPEPPAHRTRCAEQAARRYALSPGTQPAVSKGALSFLSACPRTHVRIPIGLINHHAFNHSLNYDSHSLPGTPAQTCLACSGGQRLQ
jgi:hypothetical protein